MENKLDEKTQFEHHIAASPRPSISASPEKIKVSILFFGATADAVGERDLEISFETAKTAKEIFAEILEKYPQLKEHSLLFAVNQEYSDGDDIIENGDELAIFTAVSGG